MEDNILLRILNKLEDNLEDKIRGFSDEKLLSMGRNYATDSYDYIQSALIFSKLSHNNREAAGETAELYKLLLVSLSFPKTQNPRISNFIAGNAIHCMAMATEMHSEKSPSKEDLFAIETLIGRIEFTEMPIRNRDEFEKIYCRFKEYALDVFTGKR